MQKEALICAGLLGAVLFYALGTYERTQQVIIKFVESPTSVQIMAATIVGIVLLVCYFVYKAIKKKQKSH